MIAAVSMTPVLIENLPSPITPVLNKIQGKNATSHPTGFWKQLYILVKRNAIQLSRDRVNIKIICIFIKNINVISSTFLNKS